MAGTMLGGGKASGRHSTGAVVGRGKLRGRDVDRKWGGCRGSRGRRTCSLDHR